MSIKEKAKEYAIKAHTNQIRKSNGKSMIYHPIAVGKLLESLGYDDEIVAAGYLHDTVEDTKTTIIELENLFGERIAKLVFNASEPDKSLSWEERKMHTIHTVENNDINDISVVLADKIHNIEDLTNELKIQGLSVCNSFKRGIENQLWYFEGIYNAAVTSHNHQHPLIERLGRAIDNLKNEIKYQTQLETEIFYDNEKLLNKLRELHILKYKIKEEGYIKPFVIELLGTPRTGKTTIINNILDFFKKGGFKVTYFKELVTSEFYNTINHLPLHDRNLAIIDEIVKQLKSIVEVETFDSNNSQEKDVDLRVYDNNGEIIVFDRGVYDRLIWFRRLLNKGELEREQYNKIITKYSEYLSLINCLLCFTASPEVSLKRDYISSLSLEKRSFLTKENIDSYNLAMNNLIEDEVINNHHLIDTDNQTITDSAIAATEYVLKKIKL
ncbi:MAG: HD domain-containing protein [Bacilli bacterium]|nr:HD domain-containing protein [Bacilli bacterium]